jgi:catechol 2,3-dioxygenase-like lactoylglutathione lyase family enzyme
VLAGFDHLAVLTDDLERFVAFYVDVFGAEVEGTLTDGDLRMTVVRIGPTSELNVFEVDGNDEHARQTPMFGRGRLDHFGLRAESIEQFDELRDRLIELGCTDGFVTDFGHVLSVFFRDPQGLEGEICVANPDAVPGRINPPGTPAARYHG